MSEQSTEQVLRGALGRLVGHFEDNDFMGTVESRIGIPDPDYGDGRITWYEVGESCREALLGARAALALPESGDHEITEGVRRTREIVNQPIPDSLIGSPNPAVPTSDDMRIEELAKDLWEVLITFWPTFHWSELAECGRDEIRLVMRRFLAKHPEMVPSTEVSPSCAEKASTELDSIGTTLSDASGPASQPDPPSSKTLDWFDSILTRMLTWTDDAFTIRKSEVCEVCDQLIRLRSSVPARPVPQPDVLAQVGRLLDEEIVREQAAALKSCKYLKRYLRNDFASGGAQALLTATTRRRCYLEFKALLAERLQGIEEEKK